MADFMKPYSSQTYALMRIIVSLLFLCHGLSKVFHFPTAPPPELPAFIAYGAGSIELVCGALIAVGLFTRGAAFIASGEMAFAYWLGHGTRALFPIANHGELAVLFCFVFLFVASQGPGIWSADGARANGKS
jgi:putative oxidoreductase